MNDSGLETTRVPRALEMKSKLFGFELPDLLLIFFTLAFTNFIFGSTSFRYPLVWGTTLSLALFLFFAKRGKPDNYLQHLGEFIASATYFTAGAPDQQYQRLNKESLDELKK
ncbi:MAG TPA: hypothetical protein PLJ21_08390 [Pseudobdellovibrionaceae bacterium]|nr:hypothetical protein [Pseudobdellovibrionaceae bacterium]